MTASIGTLAVSVLATETPRDKAAQGREVAAIWQAGNASLPETMPETDEIPAPSRPARPELVPPAKVPRRRLNSPSGRVALLHAVAHIELNAIDLAFDLVARFAADPRISDDEREAFVDDWIRVGDDESRHFVMVDDRLNQLDAAYGDHPAHNGLWDAAMATQHDLAARLAVAPLVLEARGLDVTPAMIERLVSAGDTDSANVLRIIYNEEIGHVGAGARWFRHLCRNESTDPQTRYQELVRTYFKGGLKPPFNAEARQLAQFPADFYEPLAESGPSLA